MKQKLLNKIYGYLKKTKTPTPLPKIAIAVSGGSDSVALAYLIAKYGKNLYQESLVFVHVNHMWRDQESFSDQAFVEQLGKQFNIPVHVYLCPLDENSKDSKELDARNQRLEVFKQYTDNGYLVFTGHNSNDVMETMLWRLCHGKLESHSEGILVKTKDNQFRPFLTTEKDTLREFLLSENQTWVEDYTNHDGKLMRSYMRKNVIPKLLTIYPKALEKISIECVSKQKY